MKIRNHHFHKKQNAGFTLAELLVSIAIMVMILGVILINYHQFDSSIVLTNIAYDIGLSVRKAQTYGISVKGVQNGSFQTYDNTYGVHFDAATPQQYRIFVDEANNGYDVTDQTIELFTIPNPYTISKICTVEGATTLCSDSSTRQQFDMTFHRPNPDAKMYWDTATPSTSTPIAGYIEIHVQSKNDTSLTRTIIIRTTGQISISR